MSGRINNQQAGHMMDIARRLTLTIKSEAEAIDCDPDAVTVPTLVEALALAVASGLGVGASPERVREGITMVTEFLVNTTLEYLRTMEREEGHN